VAQGRPNAGVIVAPALSRAEWAELQDPGGRPSLVAPLNHRGRSVGLLWVADRPEGYDEEDQALLSRVAAVLAPWVAARLERDRQAAEGRRAEERFRTLTEQTSDWIWEVDEDGTYTYVSPKVRDLLGHDPEEVLGKTPFDLMPPDEAERIAGAFAAIASARQPLERLENINLHKDGRRVVLETSGVPVFDASGRFAGYRGIDRDITARKQAEARLLQAERLAALGQLLAGVAHEINNPVNFVYGNLKVLAEELVPVRRALEALSEGGDLETARARAVEALRADPVALLDELSEIVADCHEGARRVQQLVRDLLRFAQPARGGRAPTDLHRVLDATLTLLVSEYRDRIDLRKDYADVGPVLANEAQLGQVFMNLLMNAAQAIEGTGTVTVSTRAEGDAVLVSITDTGRGIPEAELGEVFEPFFTTKEVGEGMGLGLAISYGFVQAHGGELDVDSEPGRGSTFTVRLPVLETG